MEGYTTIEINGQTVGLLFGLYAVREIFGKLEGKSIDLSEPGKQIASFKKILYAGYLNDREAMDEEPVLSKRDFHMFIEKCAHEKNMKPVLDAVQAYNNSVFVKEVSNGTVENDKKKNQLIGTM